MRLEDKENYSAIVTTTQFRSIPLKTLASGREKSESEITFKISIPQCNKLLFSCQIQSKNWL